METSCHRDNFSKSYQKRTLIYIYAVVGNFLLVFNFPSGNLLRLHFCGLFQCYSSKPEFKLECGSFAISYHNLQFGKNHNQHTNVPTVKFFHSLLSLNLYSSGGEVLLLYSTVCVPTATSLQLNHKCWNHPSHHSSSFHKPPHSWLIRYIFLNVAIRDHYYELQDSKPLPTQHISWLKPISAEPANPLIELLIFIYFTFTELWKLIQVEVAPSLSTCWETCFLVFVIKLISVAMVMFLHIRFFIGFFNLSCFCSTQERKAWKPTSVRSLPT